MCCVNACGNKLCLVTIAAVSTLHDYNLKDREVSLNRSERFKFTLKIIRIDNLLYLLKFNIRLWNVMTGEWRPKNVSISVQLLCFTMVKILNEAHIFNELQIWLNWLRGCFEHCSKKRIAFPNAYEIRGYFPYCPLLRRHFHTVTRNDTEGAAPRASWCWVARVKRAVSLHWAVRLRRASHLQGKQLSTSRKRR